MKTQNLLLRPRRIALALSIAILVFVPLLYLNIPQLEFMAILKENVCLLLIACSLISIFLFRAPALHSHEKILLLLIGYALINTIFRAPRDVNSAALIILATIVYLLWRSILACDSIKVYTNRIMAYYTCILAVYCSFFFLGNFYNGSSFFSFFAPNISIFAELLTAQLLFVFPWAIQIKNVKIKGIIFVILLVSTFLLILTKGRGAWLSLIIASCLFIRRRTQSNPPNNNLIWALLGFSLVAVAFACVYLKPLSSFGRLFIYRMDAQMFFDNWLFGIGAGHFKMLYNDYQASFFFKHGLDNIAALTAENTVFAFNDPFQWWIENGLIGGGALFYAVFLFAKNKRNISKISSDYLLEGALLSGLTIVLCSFVSYPFQVLPIFMQFLFCFAIVNSRMQSVSKSRFTISSWVTGSIAIVLVFHFVVEWQIKRATHDAFIKSRQGFHVQALNRLESVMGYYNPSGNVLFLYATELYNRNRISAAEQVLERSKRIYNTSDSYILAGNIYHELGMQRMAEQSFLKAVYIMPKKASYRVALAMHYDNFRQYHQAQYWFRSVLKVPITKSEDAWRVRQMAIEKLKTYPF